MKATSQITIPAVTIGHNDLKHLVTRLVEYFKDKNISNLKSTVSFVGKNYKEEFRYNNFPEFLNFKEDLNFIEISITADDLNILIVLSSEERNPLKAFFSKAEVESEDRMFTNGITEEIISFFEKRKNYHEIIHGYGIFISIVISLLLYVIFLDIFSSTTEKYKFNRELVIFTFMLLSYPIKSYLRWLFPYTYFINENRQRRFQRVVFYGINMSLIGRFIFLLFEKDLKSVLGL